jgi:hypothetical protein
MLIQMGDSDHNKKRRAARFQTPAITATTRTTITNHNYQRPSKPMTWVCLASGPQTLLNFVQKKFDAVSQMSQETKIRKGLLPCCCPWMTLRASFATGLLPLSLHVQNKAAMALIKFDEWPMLCIPSSSYWVVTPFWTMDRIKELR